MQQKKKMQQQKKDSHCIFAKQCMPCKEAAEADLSEEQNATAGTFEEAVDLSKEHTAQAVDPIFVSCIQEIQDIKDKMPELKKKNNYKKKGV